MDMPQKPMSQSDDFGVPAEVTEMAAALDEIRQSRTSTPDAGGSSAEASASALVTPPAATEQAQSAESSAGSTEVGATPKTDAANDPAEKLRIVQEQLHRANSELGRVNALNYRYNEARLRAERLEQEIAALKQQQSAAPAPAQDTKDELTAALEKYKDFPELAQVLQDAIRIADGKAKQAAIEVTTQAVAPLNGIREEAEYRRQQEAAAAQQAAMNRLQAVYPMDSIRAIATSDDFKAWLATAPSLIKSAHDQGQGPDEAMIVLDAYDAHLRRAGKPSISSAKAASAQSAPTPYPQRTPAAPAKVNAARLAAAAGLPSRGAGQHGGLPPEDDFEGALTYFRQQRLRQQKMA